MLRKKRKETRLKMFHRMEAIVLIETTWRDGAQHMLDMSIPLFAEQVPFQKTWDRIRG